jgi:hypothetical protein
MSTITTNDGTRTYYNDCSKNEGHGHPKSMTRAHFAHVCGWAP